MTSPMRPYSMGLGYGMNQMGNEPGYFGESDPGRSIAQAMLQARASKRQDEEEKSLNAERESTAKWRDAQTQHEATMDPINLAIARARLVGMGAQGPNAAGGGGGGGGGTFQDGMPPASAGAGGGGRMGGGDKIQFGADGAHTMPGAFNPMTGQHNPASGAPQQNPNIDLGGGWSMPSLQSTQGTSADELLHSGLLKNLTPAAAMYLSQHPEHIAGLIAAERERGQGFSEWKERWDYEGRHPHRLNPMTDKPEITLAGALQEIDRQYGGGQSGQAIERLGGADKRMQLAQQMMRPDFDPSHMPMAGPSDASARHRSRTGRPLPVGSKEEQQGDLDSLTRNKQIAQIRDMIPAGADSAKVSEVLRSHGLSDEEIEGVTKAPQQSRPAQRPTLRKPKAAGAGSTF